MFIGEQCSVESFGLVFHGYIHSITDTYVEVHHDPFDIDVDNWSTTYAGVGIDRIPVEHGFASRKIICGGLKLGETSEKRIEENILRYIHTKRYWLLTMSFISMDSSVSDIVLNDYSRIIPYTQTAEDVIQDCMRAYNRLLTDGYDPEVLAALFRLSPNEVRTLSNRDYDFWREGDSVDVELTYMKAKAYISYKGDGVLKIRYNPYTVISETPVDRQMEITLFKDDVVNMSLSTRDYTARVERDINKYTRAKHYIAILHHIGKTYALPPIQDESVISAMDYSLPLLTSFSNIASYFKEVLIQYSNAVGISPEDAAAQFGLTADEIDYLFRKETVHASI